MNPSDDPARSVKDLTLHIKSDNWEKETPGIEEIANFILGITLHQLNLVGLNLEMSLVLADDNFVQGYNRDYRNKDHPTNVLSFPALDNPQQIKDGDNLGDIMMAYETIAREAKEQNKSFRNHFAHLEIHGILHLLGYDHIEEDEADEMEALEVKILEQLGVADPYQEMGS